MRLKAHPEERGPRSNGFTVASLVGRFRAGFRMALMVAGGGHAAGLPRCCVRGDVAAVASLSSTDLMETRSNNSCYTFLADI